MVVDMGPGFYRKFGTLPDGSFYAVEIEQYLCPEFIAPFVSDNGVSRIRTRFLHSLRCVLK